MRSKKLALVNCSTNTSSRLASMKTSSLKFATREEIIELMGTETCPLCLEAPTYPVTAKCGHLFCEYCIYKWLQDDKKPCPMCRASLVFDKQKGIIRPTFISTSLHSPSSSEVGILTQSPSSSEVGDRRKRRRIMKYEDDDKVLDTACSDTSIQHDKDEVAEACPDNSLPSNDVEADDSCLKQFASPS